MKRFSILVGLAAAAIIFTGCGGGGGGGGGYVPPPPAPGPSLAALYLDDSATSPVAGVYYYCDTGDGTTDGNGEFLYYPGESCTFDLTGFAGSWTDPLYIDYADGSGVQDIYYECFYSGAGYTTWQGEFYYDANDECTFYNL